MTPTAQKAAGLTRQVAAREAVAGPEQKDDWVALHRRDARAGRVQEQEFLEQQARLMMEWRALLALQQQAARLMVRMRLLPAQPQVSVARMAEPQRMEPESTAQRAAPQQASRRRVPAVVLPAQ